MDQIKIGRFIAECRKKQNLTQLQLAEKLNITDRAVSKWENGKTMPDSAIMLELCGVLGISVNDLLNGEKLSVENYNRKTEEQLLDIIQQKERSDKLLQGMRIFTYILLLLVYVGLLFVLNQMPYSDLGMLLVVVFEYSLLAVFIVFNFKIFRFAGYWKCKDCGHAYNPTLKQSWHAFYFFSWARLRCPNCKKRRWHKKVYQKD